MHKLPKNVQTVNVQNGTYMPAASVAIWKNLEEIVPITADEESAKHNAFAFIVVGNSSDTKRTGPNDKPRLNIILYEINDVMGIQVK